MKHNSEGTLIGIITGLLYPFILLFGIYLIANGHNTPGGGFQGGAVLAALFLARFIVSHADDLQIKRIHVLEKLFFAMLILVPTLFVFAGLQTQYPGWKVPYLILMNAFIGLKVAFGLTIVVYQFGFFEGR